MIYSFKIRLLTIVGLVALSLLIALGRSFQLQVLEGARLEKLAQSQHQRTVVLEPKRGRITDQKGRILAVSIPVKSLYANPKEIKSVPETARVLSPHLGISYHKLKRRLTSKRSFIWLKRQIDPEQAKALEKLMPKGTGFVEEYRRYYPQRNAGGQMLGFTGIDSQGLEGLEYEYEPLLKGKPQGYIVEKEGTYRTVPLKGYPERPPEQFSLQLTLDSRIQHLTEKHLAQGVIEAQADRGTAIVMDSASGAILAVASYPGFDPNRYRQFSRAHFLNRAVTSGYEPGSTFKVITLSAALSEGLVSVDQNFDCENGEYKVGGHRIRDVKKHQQLSLLEVLKKSSNICAAKIGMRLTPHVFQDYIRRFGFGSKPGSGLAAEASGKLLPAKKWTSVDHASISFGQGILASPLQMLMAINVFANQGKLITPYTVEHAIDSTGKKLSELIQPGQKTPYQFGPKIPETVIEPQVSDLVRKFMISVTEKGGTARRAAIEGYEVAGKTGTSQVYDPRLGRYSKTQYVASFGGFVPANDPQISILVLIRNPRKSYYGGVVAAPIFRDIAQKTMMIQKVLPPPNEKTNPESIRVSHNG
ncbi:MAG: penicillin-binding protein 2 [SAR324 cluster bacterium]|nr:penicillin-binding protein 2 [SAR324 cluster bacterium]